MVRQLLKLKYSILLVMYNWLNAFYQANTAFPFSSLEVTHHTLAKAPPINSIDSKCHKNKLKGSRTCLIGYIDFILCE